MSRSVALGTAGVLFALASPAHAQREYPPITDRDYALDLYSGGVIGSVRVIGMGGVSVANAEGSVGTLSNVAAAAVRRTTKSGTFAWDFHADVQTAAFASDFDNNGLDDTDKSSAKLATAGLIFQIGPWGFGLSATASTTQIVVDDGDPSTVDGTMEPGGLVGRLAVARSFRKDEHTVGIGLRFGSLVFTQAIDGAKAPEMFTIAGPSAELGYVWRPPERSLRVGAAGALPVRTFGVSVGDCDPLDCQGYILPERVEVPWVVSTGVAYRFAQTPWNRRVDKQYRDEGYLLVGADLVLTGGVTEGHGLEAFARHQLQRSGEHPVVTARVGAEAEAIPGWLRLRIGSYWEPGRFEDSHGRLHGTAGIDVRLVQFSLFGSGYRVQLSATADAAPRYGNTGVSIGFWH
jgi:hypothetical protein